MLVGRIKNDGLMNFIEEKCKILWNFFFAYGAGGTVAHFLMKKLEYSQRRAGWNHGKS